MSSENVYYSRVWLNGPEDGGSAHMITTVTVDRNNRTESISATLDLADCSRKVSIDLDSWSKEDIPRIKRKIRLIKREVDSMASALLAELKRIEDEGTARE